MKQTAIEWLYDQIENKGKSIYEVIEQAKAMQDEQMQLTWNNAIDAVQKDKWYSYDEFYNETFKSE